MKAVEAGKKHPEENKTGTILDLGDFLIGIYIFIDLWILENKLRTVGKTNPECDQ